MSKKFKCGDKVIVIAGSAKSTIGNIKSIRGSFAIVDGVATRKSNRNSGSKKTNESHKNIGQTIHLSNLSHFENGSRIRIRYVISGDGIKKSRISKETGSAI